MLTSRAHVLRLAAGPDCKIDLRSVLKFPTTNNNEAIFQLPHLPVGDTVLFKHRRKYYSVPQVGMDVALSFPKACDVLLGTPGSLLDLFSPDRRTESSNSNIKNLFDANILCLQEVRGKDEYVQAIQVLAPRFRFFGSFTPQNANAGGSAICIHKDIYLKRELWHVGYLSRP